MSVEGRHRDDRYMRRDLVVREDAEVRKHPSEQPPEVWPERWRAQQHRLCHGLFERAGNPARDTLGLLRIEREDRALLRPDQRREESLFQHRRYADDRQLALLRLIRTADRAADRAIPAATR